MKKLVFKMARPFFPLLKLYWFLFRPKTTGVKCALYFNNQVLLIRNSYGKKLWTLPGGGVHRNESIEAAAIREVREEVGILVPKPVFCGSVFYDGEYKRNTIHVFAVKIQSLDFKIDGMEIEEAHWFGLDALPKVKSHLLWEFLKLSEEVAF